jgi:hypothetical protein
MSTEKPDEPALVKRMRLALGGAWNPALIIDRQEIEEFLAWLDEQRVTTAARIEVVRDGLEREMRYFVRLSPGSYAVEPTDLKQLARAALKALEYEERDK